MSKGEIMETGRAFSYVFEDENWISKILIGGLIFLFSFLIFPFFIILGYFVEIIRRTANDIEPVLPEWDNIGEKLSKGFSLFILYLLYEIPIALIIIIYVAISAVLGSSVSAQGAQTTGSLIALLGLLVTLIISIYSIILILVLPVATMKYALSDKLSQAFKLKEIWSVIKNNFADLIIVILLTYVASIIGALGSIAILIGAAFTYFYALTVTGNLYGQLSKKASGKMEVETLKETA